MKKATWIIFLFAILMIALLVSCAEPVDPLPDETTPEVTTEPTNITSEAEEVSIEITTAEKITVDDLTTETMVEMPEWVSSPSSNIPVMYLAQITEEGETADIAQEPIQIPETETPWYITEWEPEAALAVDNPAPGELTQWIKLPKIPDKKISEEKENLAIKLPKTGEYICEDFTLRVETFQEYYRLGASVQIRCTIELQDADLMRFAMSEHMLTFRRTDSSEYLPIDITYLNHDGQAEKRRYYQGVYIKTATYLIGVSAGAFPENVTAHDIEENGVCVIEHTILANSKFFEVDAEGSYYLRIELIEHTLGYIEFEGKRYSIRKYIVDIPIEVVEIEYVDP